MKINARCTNSTITSVFGAFILFVLAATFSSSANATTAAEGYQANAQAPIQLAWWNHGWYGRHYGGWWGGPRYGVCPRVCWRGAWGYVHCGRRC